MAMIRVTDDGGGIPTDQCQTAFLRHATSKLRTAQDLAAIGTLGFRGEALAAIAAVSRVELFTRTAQCDLGTSLTLEGGQVLSQEPAGCPLGTTLVVRDLFLQHPRPAEIYEAGRCGGGGGVRPGAEAGPVPPWGCPSSLSGTASGS